MSENKSTFKTLENKNISVIFGCGWIIYRKSIVIALEKSFLFPLFDILIFVDLYFLFLRTTLYRVKNLTSFIARIVTSSKLLGYENNCVLEYNAI
jgi:hypothetical protein